MKKSGVYVTGVASGDPTVQGIMFSGCSSFIPVNEISKGRLEGILSNLVQLCNWSQG